MSSSSPSKSSSERRASPQRSRAAAMGDSAYLKTAQVPTLVERVLGEVVPSRHPRPYEVASLILVPNPAPSTTSKNASPKTGDSASSPGAMSSVTPRAIDDTMLDSLHFDVFSVDSTGQQGIDLVVRIFRRYDVLDVLGVPELTLRNWVAAVQRNYRPIAEVENDPPAIKVADPVGRRHALDGHDTVPFHNFRHAFNVLHTLHVFLTGYDVKQHFDALEIFAMLVSALCHDLQHPGRDNKFLAATEHPIALRSNDMAVLEQHHAAVTFAILRDPDCGIADSFKFDPAVGDGTVATGADYKRFRECVLKCILGTEVASHKKHTEALAAVTGESFDTKANVDHRMRLMVALVEAADISNEVRAFPFSRQWAPLVEEEFCRQGDAERALGMPVPAARDRDAVARGKEQAGFISFLCLPLYETLARVNKGFDECVRNLSANRDTWNALPS